MITRGSVRRAARSPRPAGPGRAARSSRDRGRPWPRRRGSPARLLVSTALGVNSASGEISVMCAGELAPGKRVDGDGRGGRPSSPCPSRVSGMNVRTYRRSANAMVIAGWPAPTSCPGSARRCTITPSAGARISPSRATTTDCSSTAAARSASARAASVCFGRDPSRARASRSSLDLQRGAGALELGARLVAVARGHDPSAARADCRCASFAASATAARRSATSASAARDLRRAAARLQVLGPRLGRAHPGLLALDGDRRLAEVDADQHVAGLDAVAFAHEDLGHAARHLRPEVDGDRLDAAVEMGDVVLAPRPRSSP